MRLVWPVVVCLVFPTVAAMAAPGHPNDAGSGRDAPASPQPEVWIESGLIYEGDFFPPPASATADPASADVDHYVFTMAEAGQVTAWRDRIWTGGELEGEMHLVDSDGVVYGAAPAWPPGHPTRFLRADLDPGTWYLRLSSSIPGPYRFSIGIDEASGMPARAMMDMLDNDADSGSDAPDVPTPAIVVQSGVAYRGIVGLGAPSDRSDFYAFHVSKGDQIQASYVGSDPSCSPLWAPSGTLALRSSCPGWSGPRTITAHESGIWYFEASEYGPGPYEFSIGINEPPDPLQGEFYALDEANGLDEALLEGAVGDFVFEGETGLEALPPGPGADPSCGGRPASEAASSSGRGDPSIESLTWAALKNGSRAAVIWESDNATRGSLTFSVSGGQTAVMEEAVERTVHLFVIDRLPVGQTLCFSVAQGNQTSDLHAVRLVNAMNDYDPVDQSYTINLLALSNEEYTRGQRDLITSSFDAYASRLNDASDGYVRAGRTILVHGDLHNHHSGFHTCRLPNLFMTIRTPTCNQVFDVVYTYDMLPEAEAATHSDGIQHRDAAIYMNNRMFDKLLSADADAMGATLVHEMGHYAFGAQDLYGLAGQTGGCFDPETRISVMGNNPRATEFDDEINRCPDESLDDALGVYTPSWTHLRERFPAVPERAGHPLPGPTGPGAIYSLHTYTAVGDVPLPTELDAANAIWDTADAALNLIGDAADTALNLTWDTVDTALNLTWDTVDMASASKLIRDSTGKALNLTWDAPDKARNLTGKAAGKALDITWAAADTASNLSFDAMSTVLTLAGETADTVGNATWNRPATARTTVSTSNAAREIMAPGLATPKPSTATSPVGQSRTRRASPAPEPAPRSARSAPAGYSKQRTGKTSANPANEQEPRALRCRPTCDAPRLATTAHTPE